MSGARLERLELEQMQRPWTRNWVSTLREVALETRQASAVRQKGMEPVRHPSEQLITTAIAFGMDDLFKPASLGLVSIAAPLICQTNEMPLCSQSHVLAKLLDFSNGILTFATLFARVRI